MDVASPSPTAQPHLVGRDRELGTLRACLTAALGGRGSLMLIGGEAGVGKTTLANVFCGEAMDAGVDVLVGHSYDRTETPPYGPWMEIFKRAATTDDHHSLRSSAPPKLAAATSQGVFFTEVHTFFAGLATKCPLVLVLEDMHWADTASLELLRFLARYLASLPLLLVVTYRAEELDRRHPLAQAIPLLVRESPVDRIDLRPLDDDAARALVRASYDLPDDETARLASYLIERSEGNALFMTELLRTLHAERLFHHDGTRWHVEEIARAPIPRLLTQIVDARLARLGDDAAALLAVAAVIGQEVPLAVWETVTGVGEMALLELTERAEAIHLVSAWERDDGIRFTHALICGVLYESVPALRRRRLHRQVGEALAALPMPAPDAVAYHFRQAGDERAAMWLVQAAERAEDAYALATAADRYETAFALLDARQGEESERGWLRLLAASLRYFYRPEAARRWVEVAVQLAARVDDPSLAARARAMRGLLRSYAGEFGAGVADLSSAAAAIERLPPGTGVALRREQQIDTIANDGTRIAFLAYTGHLAEARIQAEGHLEQLAGLAHSRAELGAIADIHMALGMIHALQGEPLRARQSYAGAIAAYEAIGHHTFSLTTQREESLLVMLPYHADDLIERGRITAAIERKVVRLIEVGAHGEIGTRYARLPLLVLEGHWQEALQIATLPEVWDVMKEGHHLDFVLGALARAQGDSARAWAYVRAAWPDRALAEPGDRFVPYTVPLLLLGARLALDDGDLAEARAWLDTHGRWMTWMGATLGRSEAEALEAEWCYGAGNMGGARVHAERALAHATMPRQPLALLAAHRLLGTLESDAGNASAAAAHVSAALALADACRAPYERALTLLARAEQCAASGDIAAATIALDEVRAICAPLDARPALARAAALAAGLAARGKEKHGYPAGLSAREVDVLRLVATGLTNAQVAERLFISARTVNGHLTAIYTKLDVPSRASAIRFALEHDLR